MGVGLLLCALVPTCPAEAWDGEDGVLWARAWGPSGPEALGDRGATSWLLAQTEDFAVLLSPAESCFRPDGGEWTRLETADRSGSYYLYFVSDAQAACFEPRSRVLIRRGHTVLLWTPGPTPQLTPRSEAALRGLRQPVRITLSPKPWSSTASPLERTSSTVFDLLVDGIVDDVLEEEYVRVWQALDDYETRYTFTEQNEAAAHWIATVLASYGLDVDFHEYDQEGPKKNVIGTLAGTADPSRIVYLSAHFDSWSEDPVHHAPGADDNASGTAALLEAARVLSHYAFRYTIKFAAFNGEEQGIRGSLAYVRDIVEQEEDVIGCFNLDMIAYPGVDAEPSDVFVYADEPSVSLAETFRDACIHYFPDDLEPIFIVRPLGVSDHVRFWNYGYKAIFVIEDDLFGTDFCPWMHSSDDRIEQYPTDYPTYVAAAAVASVAHTAVPRTATAMHDAKGTLSVRLFPTSPNPARGAAVLRFSLPKRQVVDLSVYDVRGRRIRSLTSVSLDAGVHQFRWNGLDDQGRAVSPGVYFSRLASRSGVVTSRVILVD